MLARLNYSKSFLLCSTVVKFSWEHFPRKIGDWVLLVILVGLCQYGSNTSGRGICLQDIQQVVVGCL